ncbi:Cob(I)yrinic acid a,c-diamide adenosyltransferase OS=Lysinibacillus sphaericus OX=1421 GN=LS41612_09515 PE=4 SV=1 [Lysinibacillus sphaericus]
MHLPLLKFPIDDVLPLAEVLEAIAHRPSTMHLVVTGRSANPALVAMADLVSTIDATKHYYEEGIPAVKGLEF